MSDHFCKNCDTNLEDVLKHMPNDETFDMSANTLKLLSDMTRLKILWLLGHTEQCVTNIAHAINMSSPAVSHHLRSLKQCGVIVSRRDGKEVYYKVADTKEGNLVQDIVKDICHCHH